MEFDEWYFAWYNKRYCEGLSESDALELYNRVHTDKKIQSVRDLMYFSWLESRRLLDRKTLKTKEFPFNNHFNW